MKLGDVVILVDPNEPSVSSERTALVWGIWPKPGHEPRLSLVVVTDLGVKNRMNPAAQVGKVETATDVPHVSCVATCANKRYWRLPG